MPQACTSVTALRERDRERERETDDMDPKQQDAQCKGPPSDGNSQALEASSCSPIATAKTSKAALR